MARKKSTEQDTPAGQSGDAGNAGSTTKSQAIRDAYARLGRKTRPRDIIADLKSQGIPVSSAQVSMVRKAMGIKKRRTRGAGDDAAPTATVSRSSKSDGNVSVSDLLAAKQLADQMGGVKVVRKALETLERLAQSS